MTGNTRKKALSVGLRSILGVALAAGMLSLAAPAANARGFVGGGHYWGGWGWGPGFALGVGIGAACCWGSPYYYPYYPYYPYTPYVAYPVDPPSGGSDVSLASPYVQQALAAPIGQSVTWTDGSSHGAITTMRDGWAGQNYCRQFTEEVTIDGRSQQRVGTACHAPSGNWHLVPNQP